jgi:hypothetical protein
MGPKEKRKDDRQEARHDKQDAKDERQKDRQEARHDKQDAKDERKDGRDDKKDDKQDAKQKRKDGRDDKKDDKQDAKDKRQRDREDGRHAKRNAKDKRKDDRKDGRHNKQDAKNKRQDERERIRLAGDKVKSERKFSSFLSSFIIFFFVPIWICLNKLVEVMYNLLSCFSFKTFSQLLISYKLIFMIMIFSIIAINIKQDLGSNYFGAYSVFSLIAILMFINKHKDRLGLELFGNNK